MPVPHLSVMLTKHVFRFRYKLASVTKRSKTFNRIVRKVMFENDEMVVLPIDGTAKVRRVETDISISDPQDSTILPSEVVRTLINRSEAIFIMDFCLCRRSSGCKDYPVDYGCIFMGKGVHRIPNDFGHLATPEEAMAHIDRCEEAGLVHLIGRNKLDSIWLNTGDSRDLMTICNCCPCCCLWNMVRDISDELSGSLRRMEGTEISADQDKCIGCGNCADVCFTKALSIEDGKCVIDQERCRCCGRCVRECGNGAIAISFDEETISSEVERIGSLVNTSK